MSTDTDETDGAARDIPICIEYEMPHERWDVYQQHPATVRKVIEVIFMRDNDMIGCVNFVQDGRNPWEPIVEMTVINHFWGLLDTQASLFARLAGRFTLADVKALLDEAGARDRTDRVDRTDKAPARRAISVWQGAESAANARAAGMELIAWADKTSASPF